VFLNSTIPEQPNQQRQRVIRQRAVDEGLLSFQRLDRAATRTGVLNRRVDQLGKQFGGSSQTFAGTPVAPVPRLPEHQLPAAAVVPRSSQ
jgi:hypothetical protein